MMTGNITRLPPPRGGTTAELEAQAQTEYFRAAAGRLIDAWHARKAGQLLLDMAERWECEAYAESDYEDLKTALRHLAEASAHLAKKLANGTA